MTAMPYVMFFAAGVSLGDALGGMGTAGDGLLVLVWLAVLAVAVRSMWKDRPR